MLLERDLSTIIEAGSWLIDNAVENAIAKHAEAWEEVQDEWAVADASAKLDDKSVSVSDVLSQLLAAQPDPMRGLQNFARAYIPVHGSPTQFNQQQFDYLHNFHTCPCLPCQHARDSQAARMGQSVHNVLGSLGGAGLFGYNQASRR